MKKTLCESIVVIGLIVVVCIAGCVDKKGSGPPDGPAAFEIHEWGVLVGCETDSSYFLTSRPEMASIVREPVIYVHSAAKTPFTVQVTFAGGRPTDTYPEAATDSQAVLWAKVAFADTLETARSRDTSDHIPLAEIVDRLNNVDADILTYDGVTARFLFYEGMIPFVNPVTAVFDVDSMTVTLTNTGTYPVFDLLAACPKQVFSAVVDSLPPGMQTTVALTSSIDLSHYVTQLVSIGFTTSEASAFSDLWEGPFYYPDGYGAVDPPHANIVYRIPQAEYDNLLPLAVDPIPDKVVRSLYILIHLYP